MANPRLILDGWCNLKRGRSGRKRFSRFIASKELPQETLEQLAHRTRSHYISDGDIDTFLDVLGYESTASTLRCLYPRTANAQSGDLGEILGTEVVEEYCGYRVPIRKFRYSDHREQPMRGEDIIGIRDKGGSLAILKGEAKSRKALSRSVIESARSGLEANDGRPSTHALIFVARRLVESTHDSDRALGKKILRKCVRSNMAKRNVAHYIFALTGNRAKALVSDFDAADGGRRQFVVQLQVHDQPKFIQCIYERLASLAFD